MRTTDTGNDQSMEDILASIRKMISEEPAPPAPAPVSPAPVNSAPTGLARASSPGGNFGKAESTFAQSAPAPEAGDDPEDDLADLLAGDSSPEALQPASSPVLPTSGFMAPSSNKPTWGLRRDTFIPAADRISPPFSASDANQAQSAAEPSAKFDSIQLSTSLPAPLTPAPGSSSAPPAASDFGAIVPGVFGRRDSAPASPFPKPPSRLAPEAPRDSASSLVEANPPADAPQFKTPTVSEIAATILQTDLPEAAAAPAKSKSLNGDAELAALVGKVFVRRPPAGAEPLAPAAVVPAPEPASRAPQSFRQEPVFDTPAMTLPVTAANEGAPSSQSRTLEDVVSELLRPMLKSWLDANMPRMLEAALRKESGFGFGSVEARGPSDKT